MVCLIFYCFLHNFFITFCYADQQEPIDFQTLNTNNLNELISPCESEIESDHNLPTTTTDDVAESETVVLMQEVICWD